jgi:hypothetical protein
MRRCARFEDVLLTGRGGIADSGEKEPLDDLLVV